MVLKIWLFYHMVKYQICLQWASIPPFLPCAFLSQYVPVQPGLHIHVNLLLSQVSWQVPPLRQWIFPRQHPLWHCRHLVPDLTMEKKRLNKSLKTSTALLFFRSWVDTSSVNFMYWFYLSVTLSSISMEAFVFVFTIKTNQTTRKGKFKSFKTNVG